MGGKPKGDPAAFRLGDKVRYKPGIGTYGYEQDLGPDGRISGEVVGHSSARVRIVMTLKVRGRLVKAVDAASLRLA